MQCSGSPMQCSGELEHKVARYRNNDAINWNLTIFIIGSVQRWNHMVTRLLFLSMTSVFWDVGWRLLDVFVWIIILGCEIERKSDFVLCCGGASGPESGGRVCVERNPSKVGCWWRGNSQDRRKNHTPKEWVVQWHQGVPRRGHTLSLSALSRGTPRGRSGRDVVGF